jgi:plastocyanin
MFVFRLLGAIRRAAAVLALGLAIVVTVPNDALAADVQVSVVEPSDQLSWRYDPDKVSITAGSSVTWTNTGSTTVSVTSADGLFSSDSLAPGSSFTYTFDTPGTYRYFCVPYPHMKGEIKVTAP